MLQAGHFILVEVRFVFSLSYHGPFTTLEANENAFCEDDFIDEALKPSEQLFLKNIRMHK